VNEKPLHQPKKLQRRGSRGLHQDGTMGKEDWKKKYS